jgi:hypothetical protein
MQKEGENIERRREYRGKAEIQREGGNAEGR